MPLQSRQRVYNAFTLPKQHNDNTSAQHGALKEPCLGLSLSCLGLPGEASRRRTTSRDARRSPSDRGTAGLPRAIGGPRPPRGDLRRAEEAVQHMEPQALRVQARGHRLAHAAIHLRKAAAHRRTTGTSGAMTTSLAAHNQLALLGRTARPPLKQRRATARVSALNAMRARKRSRRVDALPGLRRRDPYRPVRALESMCGTRDLRGRSTSRLHWLQACTPPRTCNCP